MKRTWTALPLFVILAGLTLCSPSWSQRRGNQADEDNYEQDLYNDVIDERPEEERLSPAERQAKMIEKMGDQLRAIRDSRTKEAEEKVDSREAPEGRAGRAEPPRKRQEAPSGRTDSGITVTGAASETGAELENRPTLGIEPAWSEILVDQQTLLQVRLDNPNNIPYTMAAFAIRYDPAALEIVDLSEDLPGVNIRDASAAALGLDTTPSSKYYRNEVNSSEGLILYRASVPSAHGFTTNDGVLARFAVRGLWERGGTSLKFAQMVKGKEIDALLKSDLREPATFLRMQDESDREKLLEYPVLSFGAQMRILPSLDGGFAQTGVDFYPTALRVEPGESQVKVGEEFEVVVRLDNPNQVPFDAVSLFLRYDPRTLEVVDADENNWITDGVNIADGEYHESFPFEYCKANEVRPGKGEIIYAMESFGEPVSAAGPFVKIRFKAIRPVKSTYLLYGFNLPGRSPTTGVFRRQLDMLAQTGNYRDGVFRGKISIVP